MKGEAISVPSNSRIHVNRRHVMGKRSGAVSALPALAERINEAHELAEGAMNDALGYAREAGELLIEAKAQVNHGGWMPWVKENFTGSHTTAWTYMRIANYWGELSNFRSPENLTIDGAVAFLSKPRPEPEEEHELDEEPELVVVEDVPVQEPHVRAASQNQTRTERWVPQCDVTPEDIVAVRVQKHCPTCGQSINEWETIK